MPIYATGRDIKPEQIQRTYQINNKIVKLASQKEFLWSLRNEGAWIMHVINTNIKRHDYCNV